MVVLVLSLAIFVMTVVIAMMALHARHLSKENYELLEQMDEQRLDFIKDRDSTALQTNKEKYQLEKQVDDLRQRLSNAHVSLAVVLDETKEIEPQQGDTPCSKEHSSSSEEPQSSQADSPSEPSTEPCSESESPRTSLDPRATSNQERRVKQSKKSRPPKATVESSSEETVGSSEEIPSPEVPSPT